MTAIKGTGSKTADLLNGAGIFTYAQIASWTQTDVEWIEAREPRLAGRIRLEEWVQSAREIARDEFGTGFGSVE